MLSPMKSVMCFDGFTHPPKRGLVTNERFGSFRSFNLEEDFFFNSFK